MKIVHIYETKNAKKIEGCVINQIKELRYKKRKDFYQIDIYTLKKIIKDCDDITLKFKKKIDDNKKNSQYGGNPENLYLYIHKILY